MSCLFLCLACALFLICSETSSADVVVPWVDLSQYWPPVTRPREVLFSGLGAEITSGNFQETVLIRENKQMGRHFQWQIEPADSEMKGVEGRAIRRTILPPGLGANTTIGIRLHLWSSDTVPLSVQAFSNVDPINGFFGAKSLGSGVKQVRAGEQDVTILWNEVGVFQRDLAEIQGYGLTIRQAPVTLAISRVELVFASADEASEYESRRDAKLRKLQKAMVDSLAARGVDLSTPFSELFGDGLEQRIWQAAHLIGMAEQLDNWSRLAALHGSDGEGRKLRRSEKHVGQEHAHRLAADRGPVAHHGGSQHAAAD